MADLDTALLRAFVALAETRSFSRTAERVARSQSAVSMQIAKLEEILGCRRFDRDKRNVAITAEGEALLGDARRVLALTEAMVARNRAAEVAGEVRFASPEDFATRYLPAILAALAAKHPQVRLHVTCDLTLKLVDALARGEQDLIVVKQDPAEPYPESRPLWRERPVFVARERMAAEAAAGRLPLVLSPAPCVYRRRAVVALDEAGLPWDIAYTSPSFAGTVAAVRAGLGTTVLPRAMVPEGLAVLEAAEGWPTLPEVEIALLATPRASPATAALGAFIGERVPGARQGR